MLQDRNDHLESLSLPNDTNKTTLTLDQNRIRLLESELAHRVSWSSILEQELL
jgi:hypothetical protein